MDFLFVYACVHMAWLCAVCHGVVCGVLVHISMDMVVWCVSGVDVGYFVRVSRARA